MKGLYPQIILTPLLALTVIGQLPAQNLVPNPGFEAYRSCPRFLGNFGADLIGWECPTDGSTDYFNNCSEDMGTPENFNGRQAAAEGEGYAGFYAYAPGDYREYVQTRLTRGLEAGRQYRLRFSLSLAERSDFALKTLGVLFTAKPIRVATKKNLTRRHWLGDPEAKAHLLEVAAHSFYTDMEDWMHIDTVFTARGTEQYLMIGNLLPNARTRTFDTGRRSNKGAYYYLDGVSVEPAGQGAPGYRDNPAADFPRDSLLVLPALLFEFDAHRLTEAGREALAGLYGVLAADTGLTLELRGHTDSMGATSYNQQLSERRCRAVADHLQGLGIQADRIQWTGYGASLPLSRNTTESGRRRNRRVEFIIHTKGPALPSEN
ncbi:OmpA family protein [Robiginitalea sp. SC105]|uniref:OmpA family protein n=1 Tax=Robiginitalea sp. SC105 TaxID=2762332 RepID=UPI00163A5445|nr:OmpA family protein [Robiginitalea sp. SC105]MBC2839748.1 OmpA family protein [Robiginitalea sp. SC105]